MWKKLSYKHAVPDGTRARRSLRPAEMAVPGGWRFANATGTFRVYCFPKVEQWLERIFTPLEFPLLSLIMRRFAAVNAGNWRF